MEKLVFQASHQLSAEWPIVLIDFDTMNLVDEEEIELGLKVLNHKKVRQEAPGLIRGEEWRELLLKWS